MEGLLPGDGMGVFTVLLRWAVEETNSLVPGQGFFESVFPSDMPYSFSFCRRVGLDMPRS